MDAAFFLSALERAVAGGLDNAEFHHLALQQA
jgi:hypothetical protein